MAAKRGVDAVALEALNEKLLRSHILLAAAGKTNLTTEQLVDLLYSTFPQTCSRSNRKLLTERVAKITPLPCRRVVSADEPSSPVTKKRRKIDETPIVNRQNAVSSSSVESESSDSDGSASDFFDIYVWIAKLHETRREMEKINGDGGRRDVNRSNQENLGDLGRSGSDGRREKHKRPMFSDFSVMDGVLLELRRELVTPLLQSKLLRHLGVEPTARILLHGPPRCGKTRLAQAIANEASLPLFEISAARFVSGVSAEENIRELFSTAYMRAPSVVFIDELDAMASKTGCLLKEIKPRIVNQLMACIDELCGLINHDAGSESCNSRPGYVLMIGATNNPDALDPALRRRFDREFALGAPGFGERRDILSALTRNLKVEDGFRSFDLPNLAFCTMGYVAGDLVALAINAGILALNRIMCKRFLGFYEGLIGNCSTHPFHNDELKHLRITTADFVEAGKRVQPSAKMEGFSTIPNAKWDDVGGLQSLKLEFERRIVKSIKYPDVYMDLGKCLLHTFVLCGPSGCGKTLIVEALAKEAGASFMHIRARELLKFGNLTEFVVHNIFSYASTHLPCVLFFDELDVMTPCDDGERWPDFRKLISELSETEVRMGGVFVIAATNKPEIVSHSSLINTQFDRIMYVPLPSPDERGAILKALARRKPVDAKVDLMALGKDAACKNFSGADLSALMKEASKFAIDRPSLSDEGRMTIKDVDFKRALAKISPSLSSMVLLVLLPRFSL